MKKGENIVLYMSIMRLGEIIMKWKIILILT